MDNKAGELTANVIDQTTLRLIREARDAGIETLYGHDGGDMFYTLAYIDGVIAMAEALKEVLNT